MADPFRLRVLKALTLVIQGVTPANGYEHDLATSVFRGRIKFGEGDPIPMISILEAPIPLENQRSPNDSGLSSSKWELLIQGFIRDDSENPSDPSHGLMGEVKAAIVKNKKQDRGNNILGMENRVVSLNVGQGAVRPADEASDVGFFWLTLTLQIVENLEDPYW